MKTGKIIAGVLLSSMVLSGCASKTQVVTNDITVTTTVEEGGILDISMETTTEETVVSDIDTETITEEVIVSDSVTEAITEETQMLDDTSEIPENDISAIQMYKDALALMEETEETSVVDITFFDYNNDGYLDMLVRPEVEVVTRSGAGLIEDKQYIYEYNSVKSALSDGSTYIDYNQRLDNWSNEGYKLTSTNNTDEPMDYMLVGYIDCPDIDGYCVEIFDFATNSYNSINCHGEATTWDTTFKNYYGVLKEDFMDKYGFDKSLCEIEETRNGIEGGCIIKSQELVDAVENFVNACEPTKTGIYSSALTISECKEMSVDEFVSCFVATEFVSDEDKASLEF